MMTNMLGILIMTMITMMKVNIKKMSINFYHNNDVINVGNIDVG